MKFRDTWGFWLAVAVIAIGVIMLAAGCKQAGVNGDPVPQPGHTTHVTPKPTPKVIYKNPKNQKDTNALVKKYGPPTVICGDGWIGWPTTRQGACKGHHGIGEWTGGQQA